MFYKKTYYPDNVELELCGYRSTTTGWIENIEFPIEAYAAFLKNAGLPLPIEWERFGSPDSEDDFSDVADYYIPSDSDPSESSSDFEILPKLTVAELKKYLTSNPQLEKILKIIAKTYLLPEGHRERTANALSSRLYASAFMDEWGDDDNSLSEEQFKAINTIFFPYKYRKTKGLITNTELILNPRE